MGVGFADVTGDGILDRVTVTWEKRGRPEVTVEVGTGEMVNGGDEYISLESAIALTGENQKKFTIGEKGVSGYYVEVSKARNPRTSLFEWAVQVFADVDWRLDRAFTSEVIFVPKAFDGEPAESYYHDMDRWEGYVGWD